MKRLYVFSVLLVLTVAGCVTMPALAATLSAPRISPDGGTYGEPIQVSMRCYDSGATIYYTTDGSEPTQASIQYIEPFTVDEDMTINAIAVEGTAVSRVTSVTYRFTTVVHVEDIAAYQQVPDGTLVEFDNWVTVLANKGENLYVYDGSGCALFYGNTGHSYWKGKVIPAGFQGVKVTRDGEPMLTEPRNFEYQLGSVQVDSEYITADEVGHDKFAHLVSLDSVKFRLEKDYDAFDYGYLGTLTDKFGNSCPILFGTMGVGAPENESAFYDIEAVVGSHETEDGIVYMLLPVKFERVIPSGAPLEISPSQVGPETLDKYVVLRQVSFPSGTITDLNEETCECLLTYSPILPQVLCWSYDAYGIVESYRPYGGGETRYRVFITGIGLNYDNDATVKNIKSLYNLNNVQWEEYFDLVGHFTTPLTAVYQKDNYLYVRDVDGRYGLVVGDLFDRFRNGDIIEGAIARARYTGGEWRIYPAEDGSFAKAGFSSPVLPDVLTVDDVDDSMIHRYVAFYNVKVVQDEGKAFSMTDSTGEMMIYNYFNAVFPPKATHHWFDDDGEINVADFNFLLDAIVNKDHNPFVWDGTYYVQGFLGRGPTGQVVLFPTAFSRGESLDINDDNEVNIADLNYLIDLILRR